MRAVLFDFGGTLDYPRHWLDRFLTHYHSVGITLCRAELAPAFESATEAAYRAAGSIQNYGLRELIPYLVRLQLTALLDERKAKVLRLATELRDSGFMSRSITRISALFIDESLAGLTQTRAILAPMAGNFSLGVVSNFYGNLDRILAEAGFNSIIKAISDSGRLGISKPDPRIFEASLAALRAPAHETVMVGDSLEKDCVPARRLGMRTVWLRHRDAREPGDLVEAADFTIASLAELNDLLCSID